MIGDLSVYDLWRGALITCASVTAPLVLAALAVGLMTAIVQAATQLQENVLSFVPKLVAVGLVLMLSAPWLLGQLTHYTSTSISAIERIGREGR